MGIIVKGYIDAPEARVEEVAEAFEEHTRLTRLEPGCELFEVTRDASVPGRFHVNERFTDAAAFEAHRARMAASDWARVSDGLERNIAVTEV